MPLFDTQSFVPLRWDDEAGIPYFEYMFIKNPDLDQIKEIIEEQIFNVDEVTEVNDVSIEIDNKSRGAAITYEVATDEETIRQTTWLISFYKSDNRRRGSSFIRCYPK